MMTAKIIGEKEVVERIRRIYPSLRDELITYAEKFKINTIQYIQSQKLSGQVLHHRKGTLKESIPRQSKVEELGETISVKIGTNLEYAAIHEYGGVTKPHVILPKRASVLHFMKGGADVFCKSVNHPGSKMPMRSFMRTTLQEKKEEFRLGLKRAVDKVIPK
jgi:phage gpG-like protein